MAFATAASLRGYAPAGRRKRVCATRMSGAETLEQVKEVERYLTTIAKSEKPPYLDALIHVVSSKKGYERVAPSARVGLHPFFIPLCHHAENQRTVGLLRWPTPPDDFPLPVVACTAQDPCLTLLSPSAKAHVTRAIAEADYAGDDDRRDDIRAASSLALAYQNGDADTSRLGIERYLTTSAGGFPDLYDGLAQFHLAKQDESSALITCERAASTQNGWARPHAKHAQVLRQLKRDLEARDAARFCLTLPLWTLGDVQLLKDMGTLAGYQDPESLGKIYRRLFEDERAEEIQGGKAPAQVALDRAAWLLDVYVAEQVTTQNPKGWDDVRERLAELYDEAGLNDMATFVRY